MDYIPKKFEIHELVEAWRSGSLSINEEYQRGASWLEPQMQGLIDSIFRQYPIPPVFLQEIRTKGLGGTETTKYEIVDGQQRIRAMANYFKGDFPLLDSHDKKLRMPNSLRDIPCPWGKRRFSELDPSLSQDLKRKTIDVFVIGQVVSKDEVRDLFIRLQSGTALTRQQIRDAWPGSVGPFIEVLAGKMHRTPSSQLFGLVDRRGSRGDDDSDRFDADRQFCSQLFCLFLARERDPLSEQSIGANDLDKLYHDNTTFDTSGEAAKAFRTALANTVGVFRAAAERVERDHDAKAKRKFRKLDVISVFLLCQALAKNPMFRFDRDFNKKVSEFVLAPNENAPGGKSTSGPVIAKHFSQWSARIIQEVGVRVDPKRLFDDEDKTQVHSRDKGLCGICGEQVSKEDAEYDHYPIPHSLGGRTTLENCRLVHAKCHPRGVHALQ